MSAVVQEGGREGGRGADTELKTKTPHVNVGKNPFKKCFKIVFFFALASRSGFGATISDAIARSSLVFCNSVSADRIGMAASRLLRAVAAFVMSFAAGSRKSYWSGCMKAAKWIC